MDTSNEEYGWDPTAAHSSINRGISIIENFSEIDTGPSSPIRPRSPIKKRKSKAAEKRARMRANRTEEEKKIAREKDRERKALKNMNQTSEERAAANAKARPRNTARMQQVRRNLSSEQHAAEKEKARVRRAQLRANQTAQEKNYIRNRDKQRKSETRANPKSHIEAKDVLRSQDTLSGVLKLEDSDERIVNRNHVCPHCGALKGETPSTCCLNGKIELEHYDEPPPKLSELWLETDAKSRVFRLNQRSLNNAVCLTSNQVTERRMSETLKELQALVRGDSSPDVPVPACLNQCINQEFFPCKICGEMFDNIHTYITHGKNHRGASCLCAFCGRVWPSYSSLSLHQLVWEKGGGACKQCGAQKGAKHHCSEGDYLSRGGAENGGKGQHGEGGEQACPLACGQPLASLSFLRLHLASFHGCEQDHVKTLSNKEGTAEKIIVEVSDDFATCPKCQTKVSKTKIGLNQHIGFHCHSRSSVVKQRVAGLAELSTTCGEEPQLLLEQEIESLLHHLVGLLEKSQYLSTFRSEGLEADRKYKKLPPQFSTEQLAWLPTGYSLAVLQSEWNNFPVTFDVWSQVVERLAGPPGLQEVATQLEAEIDRNLSTGNLSPTWGSLSFDSAMLDPPDKDLLGSLEKQLGWVK